MKRWKRLMRLNIALILTLLLMGSLSAWAAEETENGPIIAEFTLDACDTAGMSARISRAALASVDPEGIYYGRAALAGMSNSKILLYAYDAIVEGIENGETEISVADGRNRISVDEVRMVYTAYCHDHAEVFWLHNTYWIMMWDSSNASSLIINPLMEGRALETAKAAFDAAAEEILSGIEEDMTEFEKELYIHDALAEHITYTYSENAHNAYGALVEGACVCEGYAEAFQTLLHRVGIRSLIVTGNANGGPHAWNIVRIDGEYYHVDLTWNDQDVVMRSYFNVTDARISEDHTIDVPAYGLPECTSEDANYYTVKGTVLSAFDAEVVGRLLRENDLVVHMYLSDGLTLQSFFDQMYAGDNYQTMLEAAGIRGGASVQIVGYGNECTLQVVPEGFSGTLGRVSKGSLVVTVRGNFTREVTADLYAAVYDADGRMIGIAKAEEETLSFFGNTFKVTFKGDAHHVKVFASDDRGRPLEEAVELFAE